MNIELVGLLNLAENENRGLCLISDYDLLFGELKFSMMYTGTYSGY